MTVTKDDWEIRKCEGINNQNVIYTCLKFPKKKLNNEFI